MNNFFTLNLQKIFFCILKKEKIISYLETSIFIIHLLFIVIKKVKIYFNH